MQTHFHPDGFWHKVDLKHVPQTTQELHDMSTIPYAICFNFTFLSTFLVMTYISSVCNWELNLLKLFIHLNNNSKHNPHTPFCDVVIKETLEGFVYCPYFCYKYYITTLIKFQLTLLNK
jgi:hypothetical protein